MSIQEKRLNKTLHYARLTAKQKPCNKRCRIADIPASKSLLVESCTQGGITANEILLRQDNDLQQQQPYETFL